MKLTPDDIAHARAVLKRRLLRRRDQDEDGPTTLYTAEGTPFNVWLDGEILVRGHVVYDLMKEEKPP